MKMWNIVHRAGIEPTSLVYRASLLPLHHISSLMSPLYPCLPDYAAHYMRGHCIPLLTHPWIVSLSRLTITSIRVMALHIHTRARLSNYTPCSLHRILVMATSTFRWLKWEILCIQRNRTHTLTFLVSVLPLHHIGLPDVTPLFMPACLCDSLPERSVQTTTICITQNMADTQDHRIVQL